MCPSAVPDNIDGLKLCPREDWNLLLKPSEASLGFTAVHVTSGCHKAPPQRKHKIFDEMCAPVAENCWADPCREPDLASIFSFVLKVLRALELHQETGATVIALILVERLIRSAPELLQLRTMRPLLLTAFSLSSKLLFDEMLEDSVWCLQQVGFKTMSVQQLSRLEATFLDVIDCRLHVSRTVYAQYTFELRSLVAHYITKHADMMRPLADIAHMLDAPPNVKKRSLRDSDVHSFSRRTIQSLSPMAPRGTCREHGVHHCSERPPTA
eukprot:3770238-Prymnesium_polylepis.2